MHFIYTPVVKNIGGQTQILEQRVVTTDESISVSQLFGAPARAAAKVYANELINK